MFLSWLVATSSAQSLTVSGPTCPGLIDVAVSDATPSGLVAFVTGTLGGTTAVPVGACTGTVLDLGAATSRLVTRADAGGDRAILQTAVPAPLCSAGVQVLDLTTCATSVAVPLFFDADGDGVSDDFDLCPGGDDAADVDVDGLPDACDVQAIEAGGRFTCTVFDDGSVKCWGYGFYGQLGLGDATGRGDQPGEMGESLPRVDLGTGRHALELAAGKNHTCALLDNGSVKCWGLEQYGRLGYGDSVRRGDNPGEMGDALPEVALGTGRSAVALTAGANDTCALLDDGTLKCWGYNWWGEGGVGDQVGRGDDPNEMGDFLPAADLGTGRTAAQVSMGQSHACAVLDDDSLKCWGSGAYGTLGNGDTRNLGDHPNEMGDLLPTVDLGTGRTAIQVSVGVSHTCALLDDGSVKCWGRNDVGQLGLGDTASRGDGPNEMGDFLAPVDLGAGRVATSVSAADRSTCALLDDGSVKCWGYGLNIVLGLGDTANRGDGPGEMGDLLPAVDLGAGRTATAVTAGESHTCALLDDGSVKCWGTNNNGQLGQGDTINRGDQPGEMGDALGVVELN